VLTGVALAAIAAGAIAVRRRSLARG
jgi:hypothetical protein